jgi:hypothetical protein
MSKYVNKTQPTNISVIDFINSHENTAIIPDCLSLLEIFEKITGDKPIMWGKIIGYGKYHYKQKASEGDFFVTGFAPRKTGITIYIIMGFKNIPGLMEKLGKHKVSIGSCLQIKKLTDIDLEVLEQIITTGVKYMREKYEIIG